MTKIYEQKENQSIFIRLSVNNPFVQNLVRQRTCFVHRIVYIIAFNSGTELLDLFLTMFADQNHSAKAPVIPYPERPSVQCNYLSCIPFRWSFPSPPNWFATTISVVNFAWIHPFKNYLPLSFIQTKFLANIRTNIKPPLKNRLFSQKSGTWKHPANLIVVIENTKVLKRQESSRQRSPDFQIWPTRFQHWNDMRGTRFSARYRSAC